MASVSRRSTMALMVCCGVLLAGQALFVSIPTSAASGSSCTELRRWAQSYRGTAPTLDQLSHYDRAHRIAIFNTVTPEVRSALWQAQLTRFNQRTDLTATQHQLVAEAQHLLTPAAYAREPEVTKAVDELTVRVKANFSVPEQRQFLSNLGFTGSLSQPQTASLLDRLTSPFVANAQAPNCECNTGNGLMECWSGVCAGSACGWWQGCGPFGTSACNGMCR
jgi:hypothetical protein